MRGAQAFDIVFSLAGHDEGQLFVVLQTAGDRVLLADGKVRKLVNPKIKSLKHIRFEKAGDPELAAKLASGEATDKLIRKELAKVRSEVRDERGTKIVER